MQITWFGLGSFKITSREITIFTDPFSKTAGATPPRGQGNIVICSDPGSELRNHFAGITGEPFIVSEPGEYDVKGVFIKGIAASRQNTQEKGEKRPVLYLLHLENLSLGFLGSLGARKLTDEEIAELNDVEALFVPVGGGEVCDAETAVEITNELEPKIVIPMFYKIPGFNLRLDGIEKFIKEIGGKAEQLEKLSFKKNDLEQEKTRLVVLAPQRG